MYSCAILYSSKNTGNFASPFHCNRSFCEQYSPCYPGVSCRDIGENDFACGDCPWGLFGDGIICKEPQDHCATSPCYEGVRCFNFEDKFKCGNCPVGFTGNGIKCTRLDMGPCSSDPCFHGVQCLDVWEGNKQTYECGLCPEGHPNVL